MAWIELHQEARTHFKIERLAKKLNVSTAHALGCLCSLWLWAVSNAPKGDLQGFTDEEIASASGWLGATNGFVNHLIACRLMDESRCIHDWHKHGVRLLVAARKRVSKHRKQKRYSNVTDTLPLRPTDLTDLSLRKEQDLPPLTPPQDAIVRFLTTTKPLTTIRNPARFVRHVTAAYPADWTLAELKKLMAWLAANPLREEAMRDWDRFVTNWLRKGWGDPVVREQIKALTAGIGR